MNIDSFVNRRSLRRQILTFLASLAFIGVTLSSNAAIIPDPSGGSIKTWDFIFGGHGEQGICFLTFSSDQTFTGYEIVAPKPPTANSIGRNSGGNIGRSGGGTNSTGTNVVLFGFEPLNGNWSNDPKGNVIGSFTREVGGATEGVSFIGKLTTGGARDRFNLVASTAEGKSTYRGIASSAKVASLKAAPGIAGQWNGYKIENGQSLLETLTLTDSGSPGLYDFSGTGAGYSLVGECIISDQGRIGFAALESTDGGTNSLLRSTVGTYKDSTSSVTAKTIGFKEPGVFIRFNAWQSK